MWPVGFRRFASVTLIPGTALALLPKARAGCSNAARPDPWRGLWATMIPTPTPLRSVQASTSVLPCVAGEEAGGGLIALNSLNGLNEEDPITRLLHSRSGYAIRQAVKFSDRLHADPSYLAHSRRLECRP